MCKSTVVKNIMLYQKKKCHQKGKNQERRPSRLLKMYYLYSYKYVCAKTQLINTFKKIGFNKT